MSPLSLRTLSALVFGALLTIGLGACTEMDEMSAPQVTHENPSTFEVHPTLVMEGAHLAKNVLVNRAFLGIGSVILEPLDDLDAPIISNRHPVALAFALEEEGDQALELPALNLVSPGRYLVTIAIEPQLDDPASNLYANVDRKSVEIEGVYFHVSPLPEDPLVTPEPVPWEPKPINQSQTWDTLQRGTVTEYPFTYVSERTGYVRIGEVELSPSQRDLAIHIDMESWISDAIAPVLAELVVSPSFDDEDSTLDISSRLESNGAGLERLFFRSEAEAL